MQAVSLAALLEDDSDAKLVRATCIQVYFYVYNKCHVIEVISICLIILL